MVLRTIGVLLAAGLVSACGEVTAHDSPDAGDLVSGLQIIAPALPELPKPVVLTPCPPGWNEVPGIDGAPTTCEPWPVNTAIACGEDEARYASESGCVRVGAACSASDDWATDLPSGKPVLYVKPGNSVSATGTRAAPFPVVAAAMAVATPGTIIALSKGTFNEAISLRGGVTLWGACAKQTVLRAAGSGNAAVTVGGLNAGLRNLTVGGPKLGVMVNPSSRSLEMNDVIVDGAVGIALLVGNNAQVTGRSVVIRNTAIDQTGRGGRAMTVEYGGKVTLERVSIENSRQVAISVAEMQSVVTLSDVVIRGTRALNGVQGGAASVNHRATLVLNSALIEDNQEFSLLVGDRSDLRLNDVVVRNTLSSAGLKDGGNGLVLEGATATLARCVFSANRSASIQVRSVGVLGASDLVIADTLSTESNGVDGLGLDAVQSAQVNLERAFIARNRMIGLSVSDAAVASLRDIEVRGTQRGVTAGNPMMGVQFGTKAAAELTRVRLIQNPGLGLLIDDATVQGSDLIVEDMLSNPETDDDGTALATQSGGALTLSRVRLSRSRTLGMLAIDAATVVNLEDLTVEDVSSTASEGRFGRGLQLQAGAKMNLNRAVIRRAADSGIFVGAQGTLVASELRVDDTRKRACTQAMTCDDRGGSAVIVLGVSSNLTASSFSFSGSPQCGVLLAEGGTAALSNGEVRKHSVGACVSTVGFDVGEISKAVTYLDNERKLDSTEVPLPEVSVPKPKTHGTPR